MRPTYRKLTGDTTMNWTHIAVRTLLICLSLASPVTWAQAPASSEPGRSDRRCGSEPCDAVFRGLLAFFNRDLRGLEGNGRSCADCHMLTEQFRLTPSAAEARYQKLQQRRRYNPKADDPLFRPIDADDFHINGAAASDYSNLRENGLIRIVFALPPNMRLIDPATNAPSDETTVDVWRMVPGVTDVRLTGPDGLNPWPRGPNPSGGYQLDGRFLTLQEQALGALLSHAEIQNPPPQRMLDDLNSFQQILFTNERVRALSDAIDAGVTQPRLRRRDHARRHPCALRTRELADDLACALVPRQRGLVRREIDVAREIDERRQLAPRRDLAGCHQLRNLEHANARVGRVGGDIGDRRVRGAEVDADQEARGQAIVFTTQRARACS